MVTFFHDHIFLRYRNNFYTSASLNSEVMKRYINFFGKIRLVTRWKTVDEIKEKTEPSSIDCTEFVGVPNYKSISKLFNYFKARKIIKKEVLEAEYIIVRTSSFANIAARYAKKYKKPYLVEVVGCAWDASWNYSLIGKFIAPFAYFFQKKTVKNADYAIYVTERFLQKRYPTKSKNTNCSNVSLIDFDYGVLEKRLHKIDKMNMDDKLILATTGAIDVKYKGQQYVIKALAKMKNIGITNFEYQLVGGGDESYLKSIAQKYNVDKQVKFLGKMPHREVFNWLENVDIYIQPSKQEGLPRALIEAMSRGLPAFGSLTAGIPELLDEKNVFSNSTKNIDEICNLLKSLNKDLMKEQAVRNFTESQKYDKKIIENRRRTAFKEYIEYGKEVYMKYDKQI
ncbi:glycosyltransferase [Clostridium intestinale]|uniref:glycosyltransferase family 4 protein n=1 Tax=Clostridium intestinale TaxID=36845 RepID=UPI0028E2DA56|nr:glycosyltransferase [Clostridium intestinale]